MEGASGEILTGTGALKILGLQDAHRAKITEVGIKGKCFLIVFFLHEIPIDNQIKGLNYSEALRSETRDVTVLLS